MIKQKSVKLNAFLNLLRTLLSVLFPLITFPYASRILLPEGLGKVYFAQSIVSYFGLIASLGISSYGIREASKLRYDKIKLSIFSKELLLINCISTFLAYFLFILVIVFVPIFSNDKLLYCVCSFVILFTTLGMDWLYNAMEDYLYITIRSMLFQLFSIAFLFIFVKTKEDYVYYAGVSVFANVGSNFVNMLHSKKYINFRKFEKLNLKKHLKPIFILFAMAVTVQIYTVLDTSMLGFLAGDWYVGIYSAATKINKIVLSLVVAISSVILPRLSYYSSNKDENNFKLLLYKSLDFVLLISLPCTFGLSVLGEPLIRILSGEEFMNAVIPMRIMNPIVVVIGLSNFIGMQVFIPLGKEKYTLYSVIAGACINFSLNLILISKYQALGAAIATVVAEIIVMGLQVFFARNIIRVSFLVKKFIIYLINSFVMAFFVNFVVKLIDYDGLKLVCGVITGGLLYFVLLYIEKNEFLLSILKH